MEQDTTTLDFRDVAIPGRSMVWTAEDGQQFVILLGDVTTRPATSDHIVAVAEVYTLTAESRVAAMSSVKDLGEAGFQLELTATGAQGITEEHFGTLTPLCHGWERPRA